MLPGRCKLAVEQGSISGHESRPKLCSAKPLERAPVHAAVGDYRAFFMVHQEGYRRARREYVRDRLRGFTGIAIFIAKLADGRVKAAQR